MLGCQSGSHTILGSLIVGWFTQGRNTGDRAQCLQPADEGQLSRLCGAHPSPGASHDHPGLRTRHGRVQCPGAPPHTGQGSLLREVGFLTGWFLTRTDSLIPPQQTRPPGLGGLSEGGAV